MLNRFALIRVPLALAALVLISTLPAVAQQVAQPSRSLALPIPADKASRQISVVVDPGLTRTARLPTPELRAARKAMLDDQPVPEAMLRALADHRDSLAAQAYVRLLLARGDAANPSDIAYYGTIAVSAGRVWSLGAVVDALAKLDPLTEPADRKKAYVAMLYPHAWAGNALALDAVIDLNGEGRLFGPLSEATRQKLLDQGDKKGDGRVPLRLALRLMQVSPRSAEQEAMLQDYLGRAAASGNLGVQTSVQNLRALAANPSTATVTAVSQ